MRAYCRVADNLAGLGDRLDERQIGEMRAAVERIVEQPDIARLRLAVADGAHGLGQVAQVGHGFGRALGRDQVLAEAWPMPHVRHRQQLGGQGVLAGQAPIGVQVALHVLALWLGQTQAITGALEG